MKYEEHYTIKVEESQLNSLFKEILDGVRDDINEAQSNCERLLAKIQDPAVTAGLELYGTSYNDALKVKGSARDRQLKFLGLFKDRVSTKEKNDFEQKVKEGDFGNIPSPEELNRALKDMLKIQDKDKEIPVMKLRDETSEEEIDIDGSLEEDITIDDDIDNIEEDEYR